MYNISKTAIKDIYIKRNDTFFFNIEIRNSNNIPVDLSTFTVGKMQVKESETTNSVFTFTSTGATNQIDLSNLNIGRLIVSAPSFNVSAGMYYYDIELSNNNYKQTIACGVIHVDHDFTL